MHELFKKYSKKTGMAPGALIYTGDKSTDKVRMSMIDYDSESFTERDLISIDEVFPLKDTSSMTWVNIDGLHDVELMEKIQKNFEIHPLIMEDIMNIHQRPKVDDSDNYIFAVLKMIYFDSEKLEIQSEQVSMILGQKYLLTFQERVGDVFDAVRDRIRKSKGKIRKMGVDYLAYALIDAIIDNYFVVLENVAEKVAELEDLVISNPVPETVHEIQKLRNNMTFLRKSVSPLREMISNLTRSGSKLIKKQTEVYLRDIYDHTIQVTDMIDSYRDVLSGLMDVYLSSISNKTNEVMKVLTIFAAIFIPLTFIAGIYGMNFEYMPELKWKFAYPVLWVFLLTVAVGMLFFFKKRKWL